MKDDTFTLTDGEKMHPLWVRLKLHLQEELRIARERNDSSKLTTEDTAVLRGKISQLKVLIALGDDRPPQTD